MFFNKLRVIGNISDVIKNEKELSLEREIV